MMLSRNPPPILDPRGGADGGYLRPDNPAAWPRAAAMIDIGAPGAAAVVRRAMEDAGMHWSAIRAWASSTNGSWR